MLPYQKDYSWTESNWRCLWQDILSLQDESDNNIFMGTLVFQNDKSSDKAFIIIDGQEKLITLSIISIAIINKINQLVINSLQVEENIERIKILERNYLYDKDPYSLSYSSKFCLNKTNDGFYQHNLIHLAKPQNVQALSYSNSLLWQAYEYFSACLEKDFSKIINDGVKLTGLLTEILSQRLLFIKILVEDELNAYLVINSFNQGRDQKI